MSIGVGSGVGWMRGFERAGWPVVPLADAFHLV